MTQSPERQTGAGTVILDAQGRVLLVHHAYGKRNWEIPGGAAEINESPIDTAVREVKEETNLDVVATAMTGVYYEPREPRWGEFLHFVFLCELVHPNQTLEADLDEISELAFWPVTDLPQPISDFTVLRISDAANGARHRLPGTVSKRVWLE